VLTLDMNTGSHRHRYPGTPTAPSEDVISAGGKMHRSLQ
jgi:hypothetical protein